MEIEFNYKMPLDKKYQKYFDKKLLLATKEKDSLFRTDKGGFVEININKAGNVSVFEVINGRGIQKDHFSLSAVGQAYLKLQAPSISTMLGHLVLPEMEVERIFNNVRHKYLQILLLSNFENPNSYINASYNKAFQSLAGLSVYQGNTKSRKPNDSFWKDPGFSADAKEKISFSKERAEISSILAYMRHLKEDDFSRIYSELIAIKPGFHEIWVHEDYFNSIPPGTGLRTRVFKSIRSIEPVLNERLNSLPREINSRSYFSYASCAVTEGPFVFRKDISVSYFNEIRNIHSKEELNRLNEKFHIGDYYHETINSAEKLEKFLKSTEKFKYFLV